MTNKTKKIQENIGMFRIILFGWMMFGLGLIASGDFNGKIAIGFTIASVVVLLAYDAYFDKYLKSRPIYFKLARKEGKRNGTNRIL